MSAAVTLQQCCRSVAAINVRQSIVRYMRDALTFKLLYIEYLQRQTTFEQCCQCTWKGKKKEGIARSIAAYIITSGPDCTLTEHSVWFLCFRRCLTYVCNVWRIFQFTFFCLLCLLLIELIKATPPQTSWKNSKWVLLAPYRPSKHTVSSTANKKRYSARTFTLCTCAYIILL